MQITDYKRYEPDALTGSYGMYTFWKIKNEFHTCSLEKYKLKWEVVRNGKAILDGFCPLTAVQGWMRRFHWILS